MIIMPGTGIRPDASAVPSQRYFNDFLSAYKEYAANNESPMKYHVWTCLSIVAAALERKVWFPEHPTAVYPNLYTVLIGPPAVKKSTAAGMGVDLLKQIPTIFSLSQRETDASMIETIKNSRREFEFNGKKINQSSVFFYGSELSTLLENPYGIITTLLTDLYDSRRPDIAWQKNTLSSGLIKIFGPCVNLIGCATPTSIKDCIPVSKMEAGFASRILFIVENQSSDKVIAVPKDDPKLKVFEQKLLNDLLIIHNLVGEMRFDADAERHFEEWYAYYKKNIEKRDFDLRFEGYYGRKPGMIKKIMMILSVMESSSLIIKRHHIDMAITLMMENEEKMFRLFELSGNNPQAGVTAQISDYVKDRGMVSDKELKRVFIRDIDPKSLAELLGQLCAMDILQQVVNGQLYYRYHPDAISLYGDRKFEMTTELVEPEASDE